MDPMTEHGRELVYRIDGPANKNRNAMIFKSNPNIVRWFKESAKRYQPIRKSIYSTRKQKAPTEDDIYVCDCLPSDAATPEQLADPTISFDCQEKCINRLICTECETRSCPCGELCHNRQFQLQQDRAVYPFNAGDKGFGLKTAELIPKGAFIIQYIGEIFSIKSEEGVKRLHQYSRSTCTYLMKLSAKEVIDPTHKGNIARFMNHSCDPNCITQKWNVLGEISVGIFALRDIYPSEELTFDYQFDVYKTPLCKCLCGARNCKGYLGLMQTEPSPSEWDQKVDSMPCEICKSNYDNDDEQLLLCDGCNNGFHLECLTPKLDSIPEGAWFCPECETKPQTPAEHRKAEIVEMQQELQKSMDMRSRKKQQFLETRDQISQIFEGNVRHVNVQIDQPDTQAATLIQKYLLSPIELAVFKDKASKIISSVTKLSMFWNNNDTSYKNFYYKSIEFTVIGTKQQLAFVHNIVALIESAAKMFKENNGIVENSFKIPAIFLKRVLGEYYCNLKEVEKNYSVKVRFNRACITDDCYPIHFMTTVILKGRREHIVEAHRHIISRLERLVARRKYLARGDIKIIISKLGSIKKAINPTEIRCCRDNALRDINHPFYTIYYKDKEVAFIGTAEEVRRAERIVAKVIEENRKKEDNALSLNYLIPVCEKKVLIDIKTEAERAYPGNKMIIYDPLYPRKNVSITLTSSYYRFNDFLSYVRRKLDNSGLYTGLFDTYQVQMLYQMSKYFFKYLQNYIQTRSMVFMKSWDSITAEFDENALDYQSALYTLYKNVVKDNEFRFYIIRVNSLYSADKMLKLGMSNLEFLQIIKSTMKRKHEVSFSTRESIFYEEDGVPLDYLALSKCAGASETSYVPNWNDAGSIMIKDSRSRRYSEERRINEHYSNRRIERQYYKQNDNRRERDEHNDERQRRRSRRSISRSNSEDSAREKRKRSDRSDSRKKSRRDRDRKTKRRDSEESRRRRKSDRKDRKKHRRERSRREISSDSSHSDEQKRKYGKERLNRRDEEKHRRHRDDSAERRPSQQSDSHTRETQKFNWDMRERDPRIPPMRYASDRWDISRANK